jgi:polyamine oxidase
VRERESERETTGQTRLTTACGGMGQVLEARQRIGGRISSELLYPNITVDAGAAWLEGTRGNPLAQLAASAGIPTRTTSWDNFLLLTSTGQPVNPTIIQNVSLLSL